MYEMYDLKGWNKGCVRQRDPGVEARGAGVLRMKPYPEKLSMHSCLFVGTVSFSDGLARSPRARESGRPTGSTGANASGSEEKEGAAI